MSNTSDSTEDAMNVIDNIIEDAMRYRWLKQTNEKRCADNSDVIGREFEIENIMVCDGNGGATSIGEDEFDAVIDRAMELYKYD